MGSTDARFIRGRVVVMLCKITVHVTAVMALATPLPVAWAQLPPIPVPQSDHAQHQAVSRRKLLPTKDAAVVFDDFGVTSFADGSREISGSHIFRQATFAQNVFFAVDTSSLTYTTVLLPEQPIEP